MGALTPVTTLLSGVTSAINTVESFSDSVQNFSLGRDNSRQDNLEAQQDLALDQLRESQNLNARQEAQDRALEQQKIELQAEQAEETRQRALRRAVARQRAQFGASGTGSRGGSAEAVLLGLFDESDEERGQREQMDQLRQTALNTEAAQQRSLNILQAQQLKERQGLDRAIRF